LEEACFYVKSRNEIDKQLESRAEYDSSMLWMIAQPTRKEPEKLLSFGQIFGDKDERGGKDGKGIMAELLERLEMDASTDSLNNDER